jgi:hypothetical protein
MISHKLHEETVPMTDFTIFNNTVLISIVAYSFGACGSVAG